MSGAILLTHACLLLRITLEKKEANIHDFCSIFYSVQQSEQCSFFSLFVFILANEISLKPQSGFHKEVLLYVSATIFCLGLWKMRNLKLNFKNKESCSDGERPSEPLGTDFLHSKGHAPVTQQTT